MACLGIDVAEHLQQALPIHDDHRSCTEHI